jgi:tRNA(Arg) A34 adenosine deaminase TadA
MTSEIDLRHLRRCVELATQALDEGDEPFGSVLVAGDETRHPEFELARWSTTNMTAEQRAAATVYTSGEHCPMCAAAHAWVGLGRIVYAVSSAQLSAWRAAWGAPASPVRPLPVREIAPGVTVEGPAPELEETMRALHSRKALDRGPAPS